MLRYSILHSATKISKILRIYYNNFCNSELRPRLFEQTVCPPPYDIWASSH